MSTDGKCVVCAGYGSYPIFNRHGAEMYSIPCPQCLGAGTSVEIETEPEDWPPPSSASTIKTPDDLKRWKAAQS